MSRNYLANHNLLAVSLLLAETALNTEQTLSHTLLVEAGDIIGLTPRRESNADEANGKEEPDDVYHLGCLSEASPNFNKAKPQDFMLGLGYGFGSISTAAYGTGYKHTITPLAGLEHPSFTAAQRLGRTIMKRLFASLFIDQVTSTFAKDSWAKCVASIKGTGKYTDNVLKEEVTAAYNAGTLTLAANGVEGADAPGRLDNVHQIRVKVPATGEWVEVAYSAVSDASPAVITITPPGGAATSTTYDVLYIPTEPLWCTFPARVTEPPLRVTDLVVKVGGAWNGTAFVGGRTLSSEIESIEHALNNQLSVEYRVGGTGSYANFVFRQGRMQTIKLNREMREFILQQRLLENENLGVYMKATGAEFEDGKNYSVEMVFPKCRVLTAPISVSGKVLAEAGDLIVLEDATYGAARCEIANQIATLAA